ncbi:MAG: acyl-CoA dehydratase activase-related protein [Candidatus Moduliflexus flocculans]|nr:acyl-CoA dehydratase activase-related protein [Candidatus Moduliflexus flocculans]
MPSGTGRNVSGAEFCAPLTALYGHVHALLKEADYVFLPFYLEERQKSKDTRRQYCYYTQYAPAAVRHRRRADAPEGTRRVAHPSGPLLPLRPAALPSRSSTAC